MQLRTKVASVGINDGQSYVLSTSTMYRVIRGGIIFMISRGVSGSHPLHGTQAYKNLQLTAESSPYLMWLKSLCSWVKMRQREVKIRPATIQ